MQLSEKSSMLKVISVKAAALIKLFVRNHHLFMRAFKKHFVAALYIMKCGLVPSAIIIMIKIGVMKCPVEINALL